MVQKGDKRVKVLLLIQSFMPLFLLLGIRHFNYGDFKLMGLFLEGLSHKDFSVIIKAILSSEIWRMSVFLVSIMWIAITLLYMRIFKIEQTSGFYSAGEKITEIQYHRDVSLNFFASYLLPSIVGVNNLTDFLFLVVMLALIFILVLKSNLYYENPVLAIWQYKTFSFRTNSGVSGIGITRKCEIDCEKRIKRKQIIDGLFIIYNEKD